MAQANIAFKNAVISGDKVFFEEKLGADWHVLPVEHRRFIGGKLAKWYPSAVRTVGVIRTTSGSYLMKLVFDIPQILNPVVTLVKMP